MATEAQRKISNPQLQKPPKKRFIFAAILAAGLSLGAARPIPENPYTLFPLERIAPNPYTLCERTNGICAPSIFIRQKKELKGYSALSREQAKEAEQRQTEEPLRKLEWLYKGTPVENALSEFPPIAFEVDLTPGGGAALRASGGSQPRDTNLALLDFRMVSRIPEQEMILSHELIHYISWLGGGWEASYLFEGEKVSTMSPKWLAEGMANWAACRSPGFSCLLGNGESVLRAYHAETYLVVFLEMLSGREALRKALVSGDFAEVQASFDRALGKGTFEQLMDREKIADALIFLAIKTRGFRAKPADSSPPDPFISDALSFLRNATGLLIDGGYLPKALNAQR